MPINYSSIINLMFNSRSFVIIRVQNVLQFLNTLGSSQSVYHRLSPGQRSIQPSTRQSMCSSRSPTSISMSSFVIIFNASQRSLFLCYNLPPHRPVPFLVDSFGPTKGGGSWSPVSLTTCPREAGAPAVFAPRHTRAGRREIYPVHSLMTSL